MIDTHTHLYLPEFDDEGGDAAVERALAAGVSHMVFPNVDFETYDRMMALHARYPQATSVAMGLHPTSVTADWRTQLDRMLELIDHSGDLVAVGEVGIDLYWDKTYAAEQQTAFIEQLQAAMRNDLPVIIHQREGLEAALECIERAGARRMPLIFHCFTGNADDARAILDACPEATFGIGGVVTFNSARELREALPIIGPERIVLETDSPYLAPVPHRGSRNESSYLPAIAAKVAEVFGTTAAEIERLTDTRARRLFGIP